MGLPVGMPANSHCEHICARGRWHFSSTSHAVVQAAGTCVCSSRPQQTPPKEGGDPGGREPSCMDWLRPEEV